MKDSDAVQRPRTRSTVWTPDCNWRMKSCCAASPEPRCRPRSCCRCCVACASSSACCDETSLSQAMRGAAPVERTTWVLPLQHQIAALPHLQAITCSCIASASSASIGLAKLRNTFAAMFRKGSPHAEARRVVELCFAPIPRWYTFEVR